jgi:hypothetical protein
MGKPWVQPYFLPLEAGEFRNIHLDSRDELEKTDPFDVDSVRSPITSTSLGL